MHSWKKLAIIQLNSKESLVCNPYYGTADIINNSLAAKLLKAGEIAQDIDKDQALRKLTDRGHISEVTEEEMLFQMQKEFEKVREEFSHIGFHVIIPTYECELRCIYCYEKYLSKKGPEWVNRTLTKNGVNKLFTAIEELRERFDHKTEAVCLFGGEPLLLKNKEIIEYTMRKAEEMGAEISITTNALRLKEYLPLIEKYSVKTLNTTLDGPRAVHDKRRFKADGTGTFDEVVNSIEAARDLQINTTIKTNLDLGNIDSLPDLADYAISRGWHKDKNLRFIFSKVYEHEYARYSHAFSLCEMTQLAMPLFLKNKSMRIFLDTFRKRSPLESLFFEGERFRPAFWWCIANYMCFVFDPQGDIYACHFATGDRKHAIGRYTPHLKLDQKNFGLWRNRSAFTIPECRKCRLALFCGGGCAYQAYLKTGSIMKPECDLIKGIVKHVVPTLYKIAKESGSNRLGNYKQDLEQKNAAFDVCTLDKKLQARKGVLPSCS